MRIRDVFEDFDHQHSTEGTVLMRNREFRRRVNQPCFIRSPDFRLFEQTDIDIGRNIVAARPDALHNRDDVALTAADLEDSAEVDAGQQGGEGAVEASDEPALDGVPGAPFVVVVTPDRRFAGLRAALRGYCQCPGFCVSAV